MVDVGIGLWAWLDDGFVLHHGHGKVNGRCQKGHGFLRAPHICRFWAFMIAKSRSKYDELWHFAARPEMHFLRTHALILDFG